MAPDVIMFSPLFNPNERGVPEESGTHRIYRFTSGKTFINLVKYFLYQRLHQSYISFWYIPFHSTEPVIIISVLSPGF